MHRYVYYGCSKSKDKTCKCGYLEEKELVKQLQRLIDQIDLDEISIKGKIKKEVERFKKFQRSVLGGNEKIEVKDIDIRNYTKYLLKEGSILEKRELLGCMKSKLKIANKIVSF